MGLTFDFFLNNLNKLSTPPPLPFIHPAEISCAEFSRRIYENENKYIYEKMNTFNSHPFKTKCDWLLRST